MEIKALELNNTWTLLNLPRSKVPIGLVCAYKGKHKVDGSIKRDTTRFARDAHN